MSRWSHKTLKLAFILAALTVGLTVVGLSCGGGSEAGKTSPPRTNQTAGDPTGGGSVPLNLLTGDNFFDLNGTHNPTLEIAPGATVEIKLTNKGAAIHNMRFAGDDNQYNTGDDAVSDPTLVPTGQVAVLKLAAPKKAGTYKYQCDVHPTEMKGTVTVK